MRLIENHGQLGGIWTTGLLSWIIDAGKKRGLMEHIVQRLDARAELFGQAPWNRQGSMPYDVEQMKLVLEQACLEAGVKVLDAVFAATDGVDGHQMNAGEAAMS